MSHIQYELIWMNIYMSIPTLYGGAWLTFTFLPYPMQSQLYTAVCCMWTRSIIGRQLNHHQTAVETTHTVASTWMHSSTLRVRLVLTRLHGLPLLTTFATLSCSLYGLATSLIGRSFPTPPTTSPRSFQTRWLRDICRRSAFTGGSMDFSRHMHGWIEPEKLLLSSVMLKLLPCLYSQ